MGAVWAAARAGVAAHLRRREPRGARAAGQRRSGSRSRSTMTGRSSSPRVTARSSPFAVLRASPDDDADGRAVVSSGCSTRIPRCGGGAVGRALLAAALESLRDGGYSEATLWTSDENRRPRRVYERAGWRLDGASRDGAGSESSSASCATASAVAVRAAALSRAARGRRAHHVSFVRRRMRGEALRMRGVDVPRKTGRPSSSPRPAPAPARRDRCSARAAAGAARRGCITWERGGGASAPDHANCKGRDGPVGKARPLVGLVLWWAKSSRVRASVPSATTAAIR